MFTTLRSRLWLSYAVVIAAALSIVSVILLAYLLRNPVLDRETSARLHAIESVLLEQEANLARMSTSNLQTAAQRADRSLGVRVIILTQERRVVADSREGEEPPLVPARFPRLARSDLVIRDENSKAWIYSLRRLEDGRWLMLATPRPAIRPLAILRDEFFPPLIQSGLAALLLSLVLAYLIARWVADPLQRLVRAAKELPEVQPHPIEAKGPKEVQNVVRSFNEMSARVEASQRSQRDFVANVSHELKTPLTSIQGFAQALLDGTASTDQSRRQAAEVIMNESSRMHRMVLDLLDLARLEGGTADLDMELVDLAALLRNVAERFSLQARASEIEITIEINEPVTTTGDGDRLAQVFANLVDNALKFTPTGGTIFISAAVSSGNIETTVRDTGVGIPPKAQAFIFDRFFQADPSRSGGTSHGAGLGLAIVREIVQAHGGKITVQSEMGKGTTFKVELPRSQTSMPPYDLSRNQGAGQ